MQCIHCVRNTAVAKFDETFEVTANLGIDPKKTNQILRGSLMVIVVLEKVMFSSLTEMESALELPFLLMDNMVKRQKSQEPTLLVWMT